jgi:hypothetical protein
MVVFPDIYKKRGYEIYNEHESEDGDLGVIMRKVLIPESVKMFLLHILTIYYLSLYHHMKA